MTTAIAELRSATEELHQRLDALPYVKSVLDGSVTKSAYAAFLRAASVIHEAFERLLPTSQEPALQKLKEEISQRSAPLARDLSYLDEDRFRADAPALSAELFAQRLRWFARDEPYALLGVAYVLEGSTLGALAQVMQLRKRSEFAGGGLEYLSGEPREVRASFQRFVDSLNQLLDSPERRAVAVRGAVATFEAFYDVLSRLEPDAAAEAHIRLLNAEAGQHAMPSDLREVAAALRAGEISWRRYGYYAGRYGERGLRFTRSDSAWLAALARRDANVVRREILWLGRVLAHRGMPRYLLEEHLEVLHGELSQALPSQAAAYHGMLAARDQLRAERRARLDDATFFELGAKLERAIPSAFQGLLHGSGVLPAAAVSDEVSGINGAVESLTRWLGDAERFPSEWLTALQTTIREARGAAVPAERAATRAELQQAHGGAPDAG